MSNTSQSTRPVGRVLWKELLWEVIFLPYVFYCIRYAAIKGQVHVSAGRVKIASHSSCRTSAILKYFCPLGQSFSLTEIYFGHFVQAVQILFGHLEFFRAFFQTLITNYYDWFALVKKYFRGKIMQTSPTLTEVLPISDRIIRQKYYCITALPYRVHFRKSSRTNCPNWTASSLTSGTIFGLSPRADAKQNPCGSISFISFVKLSLYNMVFRDCTVFLLI